MKRINYENQKFDTYFGYSELIFAAESCFFNGTWMRFILRWTRSKSIQKRRFIFFDKQQSSLKSTCVIHIVGILILRTAKLSCRWRSSDCWYSLTECSYANRTLTICLLVVTLPICVVLNVVTGIESPHSGGLGSLSWFRSSLPNLFIVLGGLRNFESCFRCLSKIFEISQIIVSDTWWFQWRTPSFLVSEGS